MRLVEAFMLLMLRFMMWKSISLNGWKYLIVWENLGSSLI